VRLALSVWPALQIEDVANRLASVTERASLIRSRFAAGLPSLLAGLVLAAFGQRLGIPDEGLLIDSIWKTLEIYLLAGGLNHLTVGSLAVAGFQVKDAFRYPFLPHSVLDFWARYDVLIHCWLKHHIFEPIGLKRRRPAAGVLAVFATSGVLHEYLFLTVDRALLGWQLAFFLLHGLGALAGSGIGRLYRRTLKRHVPRSLAVTVTVVFVFLSTSPFIHCLDRVFDLHRHLGAWILRMIL
jgi:D-alanyl-lipoteichoic acid acyltransferase DltB (MBOAT superfamily)